MEIRQRPVGPFQMNAYLVFDPATKDAVVIDPGDEIDSLLTEIRQEKLKVHYILLTHGHIDHVAFAEDLHQELKVPMLLHPDDHQMAQAAPQQAAMFGLPPGPVPRIDGTLEAGQRVEAGTLWFEILHTPGHSPGSVTLVSEGLAFSGDVIFAGSIGRTDLPGGDLKTLLGSIWDKIVPLGKGCRLYPGHGPATTVEAEMRSNPFLQESFRSAR